MTSLEQAKKIYEICVINAMDGKTITYRQVLNDLNYGVKVRGDAIRYGLELLWIACVYENLPILSSIVVNVISGEPTASGFSVADWKEDARKVFNHKVWPSVDEIDWDYVWRNRNDLSNEHGTEGCWGK